MSDIKAEGFKSAPVFASLQQSLSALSPEAKAKLIKQVKGVFEFTIKNSQGKSELFTVDLKKEGNVKQGKGTGKPDVSIAMEDEDFVSLSSGKLNGQKAFLSGKLKLKGQMGLATKLDGVFKQLSKKDSKL
ncbi:SCP2 sterol-binding domain-containing protein [Spinellus fusiger]|nr:SCP2 sterol-binding domain-containing protein [Spinellus fusiger]